MSRRRRPMSSERTRFAMTSRRAVISGSLIACPPVRITLPLLLRLGLLVHVLLAQLGYGHLKETGEVEDRCVFLIPADICAAVAWSSVIDSATPVVAEELAGSGAGLDALLAVAGTLDNVAFLEFAYRQLEEFCQSPDVGSADANIAGHPATQAGAFQTVKRLVTHGFSLSIPLDRFKC